MALRMEAAGSTSGLETVTMALFPASRSPAAPLSAGGPMSPTLPQPNSDKSTRLLSTLLRQLTSTARQTFTAWIWFLSFYLSSSSSFGPAPSLRAHRHSCPHFLWHNLFHPLLQSYSTSFFFFLSCRLSLWNFEVALMTWGGGHILLSIYSLFASMNHSCVKFTVPLIDDDWRGRCSSDHSDPLPCFFFAHYNLNVTAVRLACQVSRAWEITWRHKRGTVFTQVNVEATHVGVRGCHFKAAVRRQFHKRVITRFRFLLSVQSTLVLSVASIAPPPTLQNCYVCLFF